LHATAREWQGYLDRVVSVKTSRFTSESDPHATATPKENAPGCSRLHKTQAAARMRPLVSNHANITANSA
jgi:hypothetical protein